MAIGWPADDRDVVEMSWSRLTGRQHRTNLDLRTVQSGWHLEDDRPDIATDVEQDRALTGERILPPAGGFLVLMPVLMSIFMFMFVSMSMFMFMSVSVSVSMSMSMSMRVLMIGHVAAFLSDQRI